MPPEIINQTLSHYVSRVGKNSFIVTGYDVAAMATSFVLSIVSGRILHTEDYGLFMALFATLTITYSLGSGIRLAYAKRVALFSESKDVALNIWDYRDPFMLGVLVMAVALALFIPTQKYIGVQSGWSLIFMSLSLPFIFLYSSNVGLLQGLRRFSAYGKLVSIHGVLRLCLSLLSVLYFESVAGLMFGVTMGIILATMFSFWICRKEISWKWIPSYATAYRSFIPFICLALIITVYGSLDVFLVRIMFSSEISGYFATVTVLAKAMLYPSLGIMTVIFPIQVRTVNQRKSAVTISFITVVVSIVTSVCTLIVMHSAFDVVIPLTYGMDFVGAKYLLFPYGTLMVSVIINVQVLYLLLANKIENSLFLKLLMCHLGVCVFSFFLLEDEISSIFGMIFGNIMILLYSVFRLLKIKDL
tara:strand:+ start:699 stop:1946 length:1248 start_codon:yes stop_codon:yes gene_type:complete